MNTNIQNETGPSAPTPRGNRPARFFRLVASLLLAAVAALSPACSTTSEPPAPSNTRLGQFQQLIGRGDQVRITRKSGGTESFKVTRVAADGISGKDASRKPVTVGLDDIGAVAVTRSEQAMPQAGRNSHPVLNGAGRMAGKVVVAGVVVTVSDLIRGDIPWLLFAF